MKGLSVRAVEAIAKLIGDRFDSIGMQFLGLVPNLSKEKRITFTTAKNSLTSLFLQALGTRNPNKEEEDTLKVLLRISNGYVDALKERTQARTIQNINAYILDQNSKRETIQAKKIKNIVTNEMDKAGKHFKLIANSESNKVTNLGTALQIAKVGESNGENDPTVFFIVTVDDVTGSEEFVLHLLPDRKTPRLWKLSEIGNEYHKKGEINPKMSGLHPNCRCKITYLAKGFGFDSAGKVTYISEDHDEFEVQRHKHGLPRGNSMQKSEDTKLQQSIEHPDNANEPNTNNHQISHTTNNGKQVWKPKHMSWNSKRVTPQDMDKVHRQAWKNYANENKVGKGTDFSNTMISLNKMIVNDNDRHLKVSGTSDHPDPKHQELRQRHLIYAMGGQPGYSIENIIHPETNQHVGVRIKADRHHRDGNMGETSWFYDGKNLKTEYNRNTGKKWK